MPKGRLLRALDTKRTTRAAVTTVNGGTTTVTLDHGTLTGLGDDDHTQYFNTTRGDARYVPLGRTITTSATSGLTGGGALSGNLSLSLAAGVAGNGLTLTDGVLAVGAGTLMTVGNDTVGLSNGSARYQVPVTGATPFTPTYTGLSTFAGSGLSFTAGGQFAVSAGTLISVGTSVGLSNGSAQYQVPVTGATTFTPAYTGLGTFAGNGLSFTGGQFAIGAGTLMTVGSTTVGLSNGSAQYQVPVTGATTFTPAYTALSTFAGNGLSFTGGEFVVGQGAGLTVSGTTVALTQPGTLTHNSSNTASGSHTHAITSSDDVNSSTTSLLKATNGALTLHRLTSNLITGLTTIATPLITTPTSEVGITMTTSGTHDIRITPQKDLDLAPTQNLILEPGGDVILDPTGNDVYPQNNYDLNLGLINKKFLTLHAAELWVETLVAQNTIATIGGRILVGPTTTLIADLTTTATTIDVKHNEMTAGDIVYMEDAGKVEFMAIVSYNQAITGGHRYTVTRRVDSSPSNAWVAGDAVFNTGQKDDGFIDLYSIQSIKRRSDQTNNETGPTIVGNVRTAHTTPATDFNKWSPRWAIGNLNGLYGYSGNVYGFAAGKYENTAAPGSTNNTWLSADENNGIRIRNGSYDRFQVTTDGSVRLSDNGGNLRLFLNANGGAFGLYDGVNVGARILLLSDGTMRFRNTAGNDAIVLDSGGAGSTARVVLGNNAIVLDSSGNGTFTGAVTATSGSFTGSITSTSGTIGGWNIGSTLSATNLVLTPGAANTAHILAGTGSTAGGINSANASGDVVFWAGGGHSSRDSAAFKVTAGGALTAQGATLTSATVSGAITATSGSITGTLSMGTNGKLQFSNGNGTLSNDGIWLTTNNASEFGENRSLAFRGPDGTLYGELKGFWQSATYGELMLRSDSKNNQTNEVIIESVRSGTTSESVRLSLFASSNSNPGESRFTVQSPAGTERFRVAQAGATVTGTLSVTGATTLSSTLAVTGATTLSSTLNVAGNTTLTRGTSTSGLTRTLTMTGAQTTTGFSCNIDLNNYNNATDATYTVGRISGVRTSSVNNGQLRFYTNVNNTLTEVARMDESRLTTFYGDLSGNVANDVRASFTRINALTEFQRDGVKGSIFTPMVEGTVDLTDTNGTPWNGTNNFAVGTYTFDVNSTSNPNNGGVPAEATAVVLLVSGNWTTASQNSFALVLHRTGSPLAPTGDGKAAFQLRAINGGFNTDVQGVVPLDANGQFSIKVAGAEMKAASCRLIGYYI